LTGRQKKSLKQCAKDSLKINNIAVRDGKNSGRLWTVKIITLEGSIVRFNAKRSRVHGTFNNQGGVLAELKYAADLWKDRVLNVLNSVWESK
jgi:hypothetical protein